MTFTIEHYCNSIRSEIEIQEIIPYTELQPELFSKLFSLKVISQRGFSGSSVASQVLAGLLVLFSIMDFAHNVLVDHPVQVFAVGRSLLRQEGKFRDWYG